MTWHLGRLAALDFESSDKDCETARIVSCALILIGGDLRRDTRTWLISPGVPMHPEAIETHHITDEYAAANGIEPEKGVTEIMTALSETVAAGIPIVGHNIGKYDLNLLDREGRRHLGAGLTDAIPDAESRMRVIDTLVLDKHAAPYRKRVSEKQGPYQMKTSAQTYRLEWDDDAAHGAEYDALMSARVAWHIGNIAHLPHSPRPDWVQAARTQRFDSLAGLTVGELHAKQIKWAEADAASYQQWLRTKAPAEKRDPEAVIDGRWPLIPPQTTRTEATA